MRYLIILFFIFGFPIIESKNALASSQLCKEDQTLSTKKLVNSVKPNVAIIKTPNAIGSGFVVGHDDEDECVVLCGVVCVFFFAFPMNILHG